MTKTRNFLMAYNLTTVVMERVMRPERMQIRRINHAY